MIDKNIWPVVIGVLVIGALLAVAIVFWSPMPSPPNDTNGIITPTPTPADEVNITITNLEDNQEIGLPVVIEGEARVFENTLQVRVLDADGSILVERFVEANAPDIGQFGPYRAELYYPEPAGASGTIEAFQYSAKDGSETDKVIVPIRFSDVDAMDVRVYFSNRDEDPDMDECEVTYPVDRRVPQTQAVGRAAIDQLLMGPSNDEMDRGFFTNLNLGTELISLNIEDGTAEADFNENLNQGVAGSCLVQAITSQITNTLIQFPTVDDVIISVEGQTEDVLQP